MSDDNQERPEDIDAVFEDSADGFQEEEGGDNSSVDANYVDIDDGDEDGIFAPEPIKEKTGKSSGLLGVVALLAVAGAGGYVYFTNPQLVDQVKQNILGGSSSEVVADATSADVVPVAPPSAEDTPVAPEQTSVAPGSVDTVAEQVKAADTQVAADVANVPSATSAAVDAGSEQVVLPPVVNPSSAAEMMTPAPSLEASEQAVAVNAPSASEKIDVKTEIKPEEKAAEKSEAKVTAVVPPETKVEPQPKLVVEEKVTEEKTAEVKQEKTAVAVGASTDKKVQNDAKLDAYFDSPGGKMLKAIPAPSLDPKKGKNESIIIVQKQGRSKTSSSAAYPKSGHVSIETTDLDSRLVAANRAVLLQRYDAAKEMYDDLYRVNPKDGRVLMGRAVLFQKMGDTEQAISAYEDVLKYNPDNAEAIVNLAGLARKQYPAMALEKLLDLHQAYPDNPVVTAQLGVTYADTGNYEDAYRYLSMAAGLEPGNPQHYFNMAVVAERAKDVPKAIANYEKALEVDAVNGGAKTISREVIYDRLTRLRGN